MADGWFAPGVGFARVADGSSAPGVAFAGVADGSFAPGVAFARVVDGSLAPDVAFARVADGSFAPDVAFAGVARIPRAVGLPFVPGVVAAEGARRVFPSPSLCYDPAAARVARHFPPQNRVASAERTACR